MENQQTTQTTNAVEQKKAHPRTSARFAHLDSESLIDLMQQNGFTLRSTSQAGSTKYAGFQRHAMFFKNDAMTDTEGSPEIMAVNDHTGRTSTRFYKGFFRAACLNQLNYAEAECESIKLVHRHGIEEQVKCLIPTLQAWCHGIRDRVDALKSYKVNSFQESEFAKRVMELVMNQTEHDFVYHLNALRIKRTADNSGSAWALLNRVQEWALTGGVKYEQSEVDQDTQRRVTVFKKTRAVNAIDRRIAINNFCFDLAQEMFGV